MPPLIATLATYNCYKDLRLFLSSLSLFYSATDAPTIYLYTDSETHAQVVNDAYPLYIVYNICLDAYSNLSRAEMEAVKRPNGKTLWYEFQMEKMNLLEWAFHSDSDTAATEGVFYLDSDICFFGPLPNVPATATVAVSPHYIRDRDEDKFGKYNGGFLWMRDQSAIGAWRDACPNSRFHEQAALECFNQPKWLTKLYKFPLQVNYGWWRMFQSSYTPREIQQRWSVNDTNITIDGIPLQSAHTHFYNSSDRITINFNEFIMNKLQLINTPTSKKLLTLIKFE